MLTRFWWDSREGKGHQKVDFNIQLPYTRVGAQTDSTTLQKITKYHKVSQQMSMHHVII
jgi:hypothetical protein